MNILIVDGNEKEPSDNYVKLGMDTQYDVYSKILQKLTNDSLNITVVHPAINSDFIPQGVSLDDFEGVAWTGSLLNIYESTPPIIRQIELAKKLLNKKNIVFAIGPAGTGKTYQAVAMAVSALKSKAVDRIIITRPAVEAGERLGFLPGDLKEKVDPYLTPLYDALNDMIPRDKLKMYFDQNDCS